MADVEGIALAAENYARKVRRGDLHIFVFQTGVLMGREGVDPEEASRKGLMPGNSLPPGWKAISAEVTITETLVVAVRE